MTRQSSTLGTQGFIPWKPTLSRQIQWDFWKTKIDTKNAGSSFLGGNPEFLPLVFFLAKTKSFKNTKNPHVWSPPFIFKNSIVNYRVCLRSLKHQLAPGFSFRPPSDQQVQKPIRNRIRLKNMVTPPLDPRGPHLPPRSADFSDANPLQSMRQKASFKKHKNLSITGTVQEGVCMLKGFGR